MQFISADKIFDGTKFLPEDSVLVINNNSVKEVISGKLIGANTIRKHKGIICPGFVNAHCHLELSHLMGKIPQQTGLPEFAKQIVTNRNNFTKEQKIELAKIQDGLFVANGIAAVGDICNTDDTFEIKAKSKIHYHSFIELIGLNPAYAEKQFNSGLELINKAKAFNLSASFAPHAPYSTSLELIDLIGRYNSSNNLVTSIHNQESLEEDRFFKGLPTNFLNLYSFLNIPIDFFKAPNTSSFQHYYSYLKNTKSIFVHNTFSAKEDVELSENPYHYWCFCPKANLYIENKLPNYELFKNKTICLGTDSLASNNNLNLIEEANTILNNSSVFGIEEILSALTYNGAKALGIEEKFGSIKVGTTFLNLIAFEANEIKLFESNLLG